MSTTIQKIWRGDICSSSETGIHQEKTLSLYGQIEHHNNELSQSLDENGKATLKKLNDAYMEALCLDCEDAFTKGFSLGIKLAAETLLS